MPQKKLESKCTGWMAQGFEPVLSPFASSSRLPVRLFRPIFSPENMKIPSI
jgi:hypothetical protein